MNIVNLLETEKPGIIDINYRETPEREEKNNWYTPESFISSLIKANDDKYFDLDPCSSDIANDKVKIANRYYTKETDGLSSEWKKDEYVFMNPPFSGSCFKSFIDKFIKHNNGILLVFEKQSSITKRLIIPNCDIIMGFKKRINFVNIEGVEGTAPRDFAILYGFGKKSVEHIIKSKKYLQDYESFIFFPEHGLLNFIEKE